VQREVRFSRRALFNYPAFVRVLKEIGYSGYLSYEFCHPCLGEHHELEGVDAVLRQVELAGRYMRKLIG
jgi:sugar phosphate isomerase/epimerase